jgi:hypothetical protein
MTTSLLPFSGVPECHQERLYLRAVIKPLCRFIRAQGYYESVNSEFVRHQT